MTDLRERLLQAFDGLKPHEQENVVRFLEKDCGVFKGEDMDWSWFGFDKLEHLAGSFLLWVFGSSEHQEFQKLIERVTAQNRNAGQTGEDDDGERSEEGG